MPEGTLSLRLQGGVAVHKPAAATTQPAEGPLRQTFRFPGRVQVMLFHAATATVSQCTKPRPGMQ